MQAAVAAGTGNECCALLSCTSMFRVSCAGLILNFNGESNILPCVPDWLLGHQGKLLLQQGNIRRKRADSWKHLKVPNTTYLYLNAKQTLSINTSCDSHNYWFIRVSTLLTGINAPTVYAQWTAAEEKHFVAENGSRVDIIWKPTKRVPLCSQWITKCFYWHEYYAVNILRGHSFSTYGPKGGGGGSSALRTPMYCFQSC